MLRHHEGRVRRSGWNGHPLEQVPIAKVPCYWDTGEKHDAPYLSLGRSEKIGLDSLPNTSQLRAR